MCLPLDQGVWFFGSKDDTLFRLVTLGTEALQKEGFKRQAQGAVKGTMPAMGSAIPTSDDLWKIIAWFRSIQPPPTHCAVSVAEWLIQRGMCQSIPAGLIVEFPGNLFGEGLDRPLDRPCSVVSHLNGAVANCHTAR